MNSAALATRAAYFVQLGVPAVGTVVATIVVMPP
jgi:hypothetical protein